MQRDLINNVVHPLLCMLAVPHHLVLPQLTAYHKNRVVPSCRACVHEWATFCIACSVRCVRVSLFSRSQSFQNSASTHAQCACVCVFRQPRVGPRASEKQKEINLRSLGEWCTFGTIITFDLNTEIFPKIPQEQRSVSSRSTKTTNRPRQAGSPGALRGN